MIITNCPRCGAMNATTTCTKCGWSQLTKSTVSTGVLLDDYKRLLLENRNLNARIAELEAYIDQLIEVGNGMKSFLTPYVDGFRDSYPATSAWESLVKDWKEREE